MTGPGKTGLITHGSRFDFSPITQSHINKLSNFIIPLTNYISLFITRYIARYIACYTAPQKTTVTALLEYLDLTALLEYFK